MPTARRRTAASKTAAKATAKATTKTAAKAAPKAAPKTAPKAAARATPKAAPKAQPKPRDVVEGIVLTGPPGQLRTTVSVENAVDQRLAIRGMALHRKGHEALTGSAAAVIAPGATAQVPVSVRLEPGTPPGDHFGEVEVGGLRRQAVLRVEPDLALRISPRRILAVEGDQALTLTVSNEGNVAIPLAAAQRARSDDGGPDPGPDVVLTFPDPPVLGPGATVQLVATVSVPPGLDPTRRHTALVPVGTADLDVIILPRTASERPS